MPSAEKDATAKAHQDRTGHVVQIVVRSNGRDYWGEPPYCTECDWVRPEVTHDA